MSLFDGKSLMGWEGDSTYWRVENGNMVGEVTPFNLISRNSFIIWRGGVVKDFELKLEYRVSEQGNSGINYRSEEVAGTPHALRGYQADLDGQFLYTGSNYEERARTTLASRGSRVVVPAFNRQEAEEGNLIARFSKNNVWMRSQPVGSIGHQDSLAAHIKKLDWNTYHLVVKGNRLRHYVNGQLMSDVTDEDTLHRKFEGLLGMQVHVGPPMKIEYRNIRLKQL
ncbi:MAG TPA: DUF1080 domain-containing protein [Chitinophagaceae bacterium]|nr:DUF1080 domain-containing protein [Chitinophagaceae bacterium]